VPKRRKAAIAVQAQRDFRGILDWTMTTSGRDASLRYRDLLLKSFCDIEADPLRLGLKDRGDLEPRVRSYHVSLSRQRAVGPLGRVRRPRHAVYYRVELGGRIEMVRILHDEQDPERHL
jgi:toxin ParE1/3/4